MGKKMIGYLVLVSVCVIGLVGNVGADIDEIVNIMSTLKAGPVEIHPRLSLGIDYDSNIYLSSASAKSSMIIGINPGVGLSLPLGEHSFSAGYHLNVLSYTEKPDINSAFHQTLGLGGAFNFAMGLKAKVNYAFTATTDPQTSEQIARVKRNQNLVVFSANYDTGNKLAFDLVTNWTGHAYDDKAKYGSLSRSETYIAPTVLYQLFPKTSLLAELGYAMSGYESDTTKNSNDIRVNLGVKGAVAPKTSALIKVGMQSRSYVNATADNPQPTVTTLVSAGTQVTEKTNISLGVSKSLTESSYMSSKYYDSTDLSVGVVQSLGKISASGGVGYSINAYPKEETLASGGKVKRNDNTIRVNVGVDYVPQQWLSGGVRLEYKSRNSNITNFKYDDLKLRLDAGIRF